MRTQPLSLSLKISHHDSLRIAAVTLIALLCLLYLCVDIVELGDELTLPGKLENVQTKNVILGQSERGSDNYPLSTRPKIKVWAFLKQEILPNRH